MANLSGKQRMALRNLLGAIVLADGRIQDAEVEAYSRKLCAVMGTPHHAEEEAAWLLARIGDIRHRMTGPAGRNWLSEQIAILRTFPYVTDLLDAVWSVAVSDSDLHPSEANILDYAFAKWIA
ncbi:MAG: hypothetical protein WBF53_03885 [Litorimonas sp.]